MLRKIVIEVYIPGEATHWDVAGQVFFKRVGGTWYYHEALNVGGYWNKMPMNMLPAGVVPIPFLE